MSTLNKCLPSNPDISGIGVRTAIYAQNLLSFIPALFALRDKKVTPLELESLETQSTTILITAFAILLSVIIPGIQHEITNYHAAVILNLSWMNNTSLFIYCFLFIYHLEEIRDERKRQHPLGKPEHQPSVIGKAFRSPVFIIGSAHLSLMSAIGIWLWRKPVAFGNSSPCSLSASLVVVGKRVLIGSSSLRKWSLLVYSVLVTPVLNVLIPMGFFALPVWLCSCCCTPSTSRIGFTRAGLVALLVINVILLVDTEATIAMNKPLTSEGDRDWTFGGTLAILLLLIPIRDIVEAVFERRARRLGLKLQRAAGDGELQIVKDAIKSGAARSAIDPSIITALNEGKWDVAQFLIENRKTADEKYIFLRVASVSKQLNIRPADIESAAESRRMGALKLLTMIEAIDSRDNNGCTAIHIAACKGHSNVVKLLGELGADLNAKENNGWNAIHYAAREGWVEVLKLLAELGVDSKALANNRGTATHCAASKGHSEVIKLLAVLGLNLNATDNRGQTALLCAAIRGHIDAIKVLAELGADLTAMGNLDSDNDDWTAIHFAAINGHTKVVEFLADHGLDINQQDKKGETALHKAAKGGHVDLVDVLIERGADVDVKDRQNKTPLEIAELNGELDVLKCLDKQYYSGS